MLNVILMTREEAEATHSRISSSIENVGKDLLRMKNTGGWQLLTDPDGGVYASWTDYLRRGFIYSRKHLYELMNAAEVTERLQIPLNTSQANALARFDADLQPTIYEIASKREGGATEDRIKAIGTVLTEAKQTGHVTAPDGQQIALEAAIAVERREGAIRKRYYVLKDEATVAEIDDDGFLTLRVRIRADVNAAKVIGSKRVVSVSAWVENDDEA